MNLQTQAAQQIADRYHAATATADTDRQAAALAEYNRYIERLGYDPLA